jgi:hypothetical protein
VAIAFTAAQTNVSAAPRVSNGVTTRASGLPTLPAVYTGPAPSLLRQVEPQKKVPAAAPQLKTVSATTTHKPARAHRKHRLHKLWHWKKNAGQNEGMARRPYVSPTPAPAATQPTALERATAAAAAGPFFVGIEGEVTVASYDVADGKIQTYEGDSFILAKNESNAIPWQDYPFNVHYRCDESGNCTLVRGGATENAKLTR